MPEREPKSFNRVELLGILGRDPEVRSTQGGNRIVNMSLATEERWKDRQSGEWKGKTEWHRVVSFADEVISVADRMNKGDRLYLTGKITTREWQTQSGEKRYSTEIVVSKFDKFEPRERGERRMEDRGDSGGHGQRSNPPAAKQDEVQLDIDDDLPF